jgi:hypothetical protein
LLDRRLLGLKLNLTPEQLDQARPSMKKKPKPTKKKGY